MSSKGEDGIEVSFEKCVTGKNVERLYRQGYAVFEGGFDSNLGKELRKEIDALFLSSPERFVPNSTRFVKDGFQTELVKKNILELSAPFVEETDGRYLRALQRDRTLLTLLNVLKPSETPNEMLFNVS